MKFKVTKKEMNSNYDQILGVGYCNLQHLLNYENEIAYSTRAEGWACDYYEIENVLISTGYAPMNSKNTKHDYNLTQNYDNKARDIVNSNIDYEEKSMQVKNLLRQFIAEVKL